MSAKPNARLYPVASPCAVQMHISGRPSGASRTGIAIPASNCGGPAPHMTNETGARSRIFAAVARAIWGFVANPCVYQKLKLGRSGDEVRLGWQVT
jgi:hypothetical protein